MNRYSIDRLLVELFLLLLKDFPKRSEFEYKASDEDIECVFTIKLERKLSAAEKVA